MKRMGDWVKQIDCFDKGVCTLGIKEWQAFKKNTFFLQGVKER